MRNQQDSNLKATKSDSCTGLEIAYTDRLFVTHELDGPKQTGWLDAHIGINSEAQMWHLSAWVGINSEAHIGPLDAYIR